MGERPVERIEALGRDALIVCGSDETNLGRSATNSSRAASARTIVETGPLDFAPRGANRAPAN